MQSPTASFSAPSWSAPVRYAEVDGQGIVFNSHYLVYCDEAMSAFCRDRQLPDFAAEVRLVTTTLIWTASARWGDIVEVGVHCARVGRTSATLVFEVRAGGRECCRVETVYVSTDGHGVSQPIPDVTRAALTA